MEPDQFLIWRLDKSQQRQEKFGGESHVVNHNSANYTVVVHTCLRYESRQKIFLRFAFEGVHGGLSRPSWLQRASDALAVTPVGRSRRFESDREVKVFAARFVRTAQ